MTIANREPKVIITITASDYYGTVEARREVRAQYAPAALRDQIAKAATEAASHAADLIDAHTASIDRARQA